MLWFMICFLNAKNDVFSFIQQEDNHEARKVVRSYYTIPFQEFMTLLYSYHL